MGTSKYVRETDQKTRWKVGNNKNGRNEVNAETQEEELEDEMCNQQDKEDAPKKEEEFLRQNMCAGRRACLR